MCESLLQKQQGNNIIPVHADDVAQLLIRLENDILPNIIPDSTLFGKPASFGAILNAASLFRLFILDKIGEEKNANRVWMETQKLERLTEKALEVSYIQKHFRDWEGGPK
jgi:hypothetical protein